MVGGLSYVSEMHHYQAWECGLSQNLLFVKYLSSVTGRFNDIKISRELCDKASFNYMSEVVNPLI